jgi:hypothetical protein
MILDFSSFLDSVLNENETTIFFPKWADGGILLIRGLPQKDGLTRLYATRLRKVAVEGLRGFSKAYVYPEFYVVSRKLDGNLGINKFMTTPEILRKAIGMSSNSIGLNSKTGKTPLWRESIKETSFDKFLKGNKDNILGIDQIYFPHLNP